MSQFPLSRFEKLETPFYYYDLNLLDETLVTVKKCLKDFPNYQVHYALKANNNPVIVDKIAKAGFGADCVSGGEIKLALEKGIHPDKIVYSGVGKTDKEILLGIENNIGCFNVESFPELENISELAAKKGMTANVSIRINPDIDAHTHRFITTGTAEDQFGIPSIYIDEIVEKALALPSVKLKGLHFHIGSQLTDMKPYRMLVERINEFIARFKEKGIRFETINVGGGLGIDYEEPDKYPIADFRDYFKTFADIDLQEAQLHFELGRAIVAQCGSLISRVLYIKRGVNRRFAVLDAGFNDLIRPALYEAHHLMQNLSNPNGVVDAYDVVGPICESTDCFGRNVKVNELHRGDIIALRSAGAYGESMASTYNMRPLIQSHYSE